jgi:YD repeat-containing protein
LVPNAEHSRSEAIVHPVGIRHMEYVDARRRERPCAGGASGQSSVGFGDRTRSIDKNGYSWTYEYDRKGQKIKETLPPMQFKLNGEAPGTPAPNRVLENRFAYDAFGNLIQKIEAANFANDARTTDFLYDTVGGLRAPAITATTTPAPAE